MLHAVKVRCFPGDLQRLQRAEALARRRLPHRRGATRSGRASRRDSCTAKMPSSPYVTSNALASLKQGCAGTDHLRITDEMLLWTPAEARRYFESAGQERPDPDMVARRSPEDTAPPPVRTGAARGEQEMISCLLCPCCDTIIGEAMVSLEFGLRLELGLALGPGLELGLG